MYAKFNYFNWKSVSDQQDMIHANVSSSSSLFKVPNSI